MIECSGELGNCGAPATWRDLTWPGNPVLCDRCRADNDLGNQILGRPPARYERIIQEPEQEVLPKVADHSQRDGYLQALGKVGFPDQLADQAAMIACLSRIMDVMEGHDIQPATEEEMKRLAAGCSDWNYAAVSSGPKHLVARVLGEALWQQGARRLKAAPFGPFGSESIAKAKSCGMESKCQFITADNPGPSMCFSHVIARKGRDLWWFAGFCVRAAETLSPEAPTTENLAHSDSDKIHFSCPECGKKLSASKQRAGKQGKCPGCNKKFTMPTSGSGGSKVTPAGGGNLASPVTPSGQIAAARDTWEYKCRQLGEVIASNEYGAIVVNKASGRLWVVGPDSGYEIDGTVLRGDPFALVACLRRIWESKCGGTCPANANHFEEIHNAIDQSGPQPVSWAPLGRTLARWVAPLVFGALTTASVLAEITNPTPDDGGWFRCSAAFLFLTLAIGFFGISRITIEETGRVGRALGLAVLLLYPLLCLGSALFGIEYLETAPQQGVAYWGSWIVVGIAALIPVGAGVGKVVTLAGAHPRWSVPLVFGALMTACIFAEIADLVPEVGGLVRCSGAFLFLTLAIRSFSFPRMTQASGRVARAVGWTVLLIYLVLCLGAALNFSKDVIFSDYIETDPPALAVVCLGSWIVVGLAPLVLLPPRWGVPLVFGALATACIVAEIAIPGSDEVGWFRCISALVSLSVAVLFFTTSRWTQDSNRMERAVGWTVLLLYMILCLSAAAVWSEYLETVPQRGVAHFGCWLVVGCIAMFLLVAGLTPPLEMLLDTVWLAPDNPVVSYLLSFIIINVVLLGGFFTYVFQGMARSENERAAKIEQGFTQLRPGMTMEEVGSVLGKATVKPDNEMRVLKSFVQGSGHQFTSTTPPAFGSEKAGAKVDLKDAEAWAYAPYWRGYSRAANADVSFVVIVRFRDGKLVHAAKTTKVEQKK